MVYLAACIIVAVAGLYALAAAFEAYSRWATSVDASRVDLIEEFRRAQAENGLTDAQHAAVCGAMLQRPAMTYNAVLALLRAADAV
jgi:hypothetical protein